ncbi:MAG: DNA-binding protein WhiA [Clostridiales bacterium]|nr:DNA-binding protein WhiA [Clostridiales bacterium]
MSFSSDTKAELCREKLSRSCCAQAEAYGALLFCNAFTPQEIRITTQSADVAQRLPRLFRKAFGVKFDCLPEAIVAGHKMTFRMTEPAAIRTVLDAYGYSPETAVALHINYAALEKDCCKAAFFRGAFLVGGSVTDPAKRYHLELSTSHLAVHRELQALAPELNLSPRETRRKASYLTYFKQSDAIADFLTTIGAPVAAMEVMNAKLEKNLVNGVNRQYNCDVANVEKAVAAAQEQIAAIRRLEERGILPHLSDKLRETARLRVEHPELSLSELAALCVPPVSKSCLNHRLRKLTELAQEPGQSGEAP